MATIVAASASQAHIEAAISAASTGDTITVPSGTPTWTSDITVPNAKKLSIIGAGLTETIIAGGYGFDIGTSGSRISGFRFNEGNVEASGYNWRVDHCYFYRESTIGSGVYVSVGLLEAPSIGLVDNCTFHNARVLVYGYPESDWTEGKTRFSHYQWSLPLALGTNNAVFIEDCDFEATIFGNAVDSGPGGRYVFRHNTVTDAYIETHSSQDGRRGSRSFEIYENTITRVSETIYMPFRLRAGTGVVFNNTITGAFTINRIGLDNVRSFSDNHWPGRADGTRDWDGNTEPIETYRGYPARDQIGCAVDDWLWESDDNIPTQTIDPLYCWGNVKEGDVAVTPSVINGEWCYTHIVEDRDFVVGTAKPGYTPYTYPHPLRGVIPPVKQSMRVRF